MQKVYKTEKNLQSVMDNLDKAYEHMYQAIEDLSRMQSLPYHIQKDIERFDLSSISCLKEEVEEMVSKLKGEF